MSTSDNKTLKDIINSTPFHILFNGSPSVQTTSLSSTDVAPQAANSPIYDVPLASIRAHAKLSKRLLFCIDVHNTVPDTVSLGYYISLTSEASDGQVPAIIKISYISKYRPPDPNSVSSGQSVSPAQANDSDNNDQGAGAAGDGTAVTQSVNIDTSGMVAGSDIISTHVATMTEYQWHIVLVTNSLLNGFTYDGISHVLRRARDPAFKLKRSYPDPYGSPSGTSNDTDSDSSGASTSAQTLYCIPSFQVDDESSVSITEIKSELQMSMAMNAFSSLSVQAAASGGIDGITGGASGSGSSSSGNSSSSVQGKAMDSLHASYNSTRDSSTLVANDMDAKKDSMKLAAGANFACPFGSASVSVSDSKGSSSQSSQRSEQGQEALTWEAQGGETLLGSK
ncbi:hypothetical protein MAC_08730 [Metarhizium acridum CQMa 102]|uniref:Uncharacterized protein n=1 Tax=Metarhizium acridum (strain CQMa 102) TaxID=655827 RepID=E9EFT2_METAQ|nr:uncharacterized protein MAC_08730 [Metarhizium acridum CQMa 102]EFY85219.1 hypothetical protein MAC_08730 [Metarhizium acridum CQMa 102]